MRRLDALNRDSRFANGSLTDRIEILLTALAQQLQAQGFAIQAHRSHFPSDRLAQLPTERKEQLFHCLSEYYDACAAALELGQSDDRTMAWSMLIRLKLTPLSDVFTHILRTDIIEIYNEASVQIFRSFNFFHLVSYTLEELFTHEWWELYHRPTEINEHLYKLVADILSGRTRETVLPDVSKHPVEEVFSSERRIATIEEILVSPLLKANNQLGGFIHAFRLHTPVTAQIMRPF